jgi:hypothetical protein
VQFGHRFCLSQKPAPLSTICLEVAFLHLSEALSTFVYVRSVLCEHGSLGNMIICGSDTTPVAFYLSEHLTLTSVQSYDMIASQLTRI